MVRILSIAPLALAAVSAVSGHVIRHRAVPAGWETDVLQNYDEYHSRYLEWNCQGQHNTTFFDKCCHPLLKGESISTIDSLGCCAPSSTPSSSSQPTQASSSQSSPSPSSKPPSAALEKPKEDTTPSSPPTTPSSTPAPTFKPSTSSPPPAQSSPAHTDGNNNGGGGGGGDVHSGGQATFFLQNGNPGACGTVHQDSDLICAIDSALFSQGICGKQVRITNTATGKSVTVNVADECPTCSGPNSVDLSTGAFNQLADQSEGVFPLSWQFA